METSALPRRLALTAGCNQLINWGISFYMPGTFARAISADRGWSSPQIYLGLTLAMLVMAAVSPLFVARLLARWRSKSGDGRNAADRRKLRRNGDIPGRFMAGTAPGLSPALGCACRCTIRCSPRWSTSTGSRREERSRVTLAGGLASAVFWPLGDGLLHIMSWQDALRIYALRQPAERSADPRFPGSG